jgi:hypothetical protein
MNIDKMIDKYLISKLVFEKDKKSKEGREKFTITFFNSEIVLSFIKLLFLKNTPNKNKSKTGKTLLVASKII